MTTKPKMADAMMRWLVFFSEGDCQAEMAELRGTLRDQNWALGARSGPHSGSEQGNVGRKMSAAAREVGAARSRSLSRRKGQARYGDFRCRERRVARGKGVAALDVFGV